MKKENDQPTEGGPDTHKTEAAQPSVPSVGDSIRCQQCGEPLLAAEKFCISCGAPVTVQAAQPSVPSVGDSIRCQQCGEPLLESEKFCISCGAPVTQQQPMQAAAPVEQPKARDKAGFMKSPAGIALAVVLCLLLAGGTAVGLFFAFKGDGDEQVQENADQVVEQAIEDLNKVAKDLDDLVKSFDNIGFTDFRSLGQVEEQAEEMEDSLDKASDLLAKTGNDLGGLDDEKLLPEEKDSISKLLEAEEEYGLAVKEMGDLLGTAQNTGEFEAAIDGAVINFEAAIVSQNQAAQQYREAQYAVARSTAQAALEQLGQAQAYLEQASELEPDADLAGRLSNIDNAEKAVNTFQQMCDAITAGNTALESTLSEQFKAETAAVSNDIRFDYEGYFAGVVNDALLSIADHIQKAEEAIAEVESTMQAL